MSTNPQHLLLTVNEVARLLRIHRPKVYDLIHENTIEGFKVGSDWRIRRASVEKLMGPIPDDFFDKKEKDEQAPADPAVQKLKLVQK
jgi:excisionase family DNA binding protein